MLTLAGPLDPRDGWTADACPIAATLELLGARSGIVVLREAFYGATRFEEFVRRTDVSEPTVSARLREFVAAGILEREEYREPGRRARAGYVLTEKGEELFPVLAALMGWGNRWIGPDAVAFRHAGCGAPVAAEVRCADGHPVGAGEAELAVTRRRRR